MQLLRLILVFAIGWSIALLPIAGSMAMAETGYMAMPEAGNMAMPEAGHMAQADSTSGVSEFTVSSAHGCCENDQAPADHMRNCQAAAACAKCFNYFDALFSAPNIHPPVIEPEPSLIQPAIYVSPNQLPFRPPRA